MKFKTTAKAIRDNYKRGCPTIAVGYCELQDLLYNHSPIAYTCGVYGWNFDVYEVHGVVITTGYRGMVGDSIDYELTRKYNRLARSIRDDYTMSYDDRTAKIEALLIEFINTVKGVI